MKDKVVHESSQSDENNEVLNRSCTSAIAPFNIPDLKQFDKESRTTQLVFSYQGGKKVPKLREPRNLYAFSKDKGQQSSPRWPSQMKILPTRPKHIQYIPRNPEPFVKPEKTPDDLSLTKVPCEEGKVVFNNEPGPEKYFLRSRVGGSQISNKPFYKLASPDDRTLLFEARFECGNLLRAIKVTDTEYQLWLRNDLYTNKHTQWYYFRVQNTRPAVKYKFTIMNLLKSGSLYNEGMRPLLYSELDAATKKIGWIRSGENIKYYKNAIKREDTTKDKYHYSLTWTCDFPNADDTYYFAHCYPYTYTDLQEYLQNLRNDPVRSRICKQRVLCRTLAGNFVYVLTVTNPSRRPADAEAKQGVVLTARVHPGETNSSWMMKGLLDYLTSNAPDAKLLRDTFIFKIVPMLNPDGVIVGNYRCSLAGRDLNRNYKTVLKDSFPPIWHVRNMVRKLLEERDITLYCDLHGHSRKQNVFIYGCENRFDPLKRLRERVFPVMVSKNAPSKFSFKGCKFKVQKNKEGTGRIVMWNMGIMNSFTMEATFCGSSLGKRAGYHFNTADFESMGYHLCDTLLDYCDPDDSKYVAILRELELKMKAEILEKMKRKGTAAPNLTESDIDLDINYTSDIESSTGGSDSSASDGLPMHLIYAPEGLKMESRKKKLKTRKERNKRRAKAMKVKDVLLADVATRSVQHQDPPGEVKLIYQKHHPKRSAQPSPARMKMDNPQPRKHDHSRSCTPVSGSYRMDSTGCRHDYLEAVTNAYMMSGVLVTESKEVPHFRYTDGTTYLKEAPSPERTGNLSRWSVASPPPQSQGFEISEEEGHFAVSYLAKQLEKTAECTSPAPRSRNEKRISSALELARKITMYNNRYKTAGMIAQEPEVQPAPLLKPRTPVQPYPYFPWQPKGDCLSSTKARLYEPKPVKEQELRKSFSQMSLEERKTKKASQKNSTRKKVMSAVSTEGISWQRTEDETRNLKKREIQQLKPTMTSTTHSQSPRLPVTTQLSAPDTHVHPTPLAGPRPMKKYTGNGQVSLNRNPTGLTPSAIDRFNPPVSKPSSTSVDSTRFTSSNPSLVSGRHSPVYVAVPADRPPVKLKPRTRVTAQDTIDISTINELRSKLLNVDDSGTLVTYALQNQDNDERPAPSSSESEKDVAPFTTGHAPSNSLRRKRNEANGVTMGTGLIPWEDESIQHVGFVTGKHGRKSQSPNVSPGIVQIGKGLGEEAPFSGDSKRSTALNKAPLSPPKNQEPGAAPSTISLTFQFESGASPREQSSSPPQKPAVFPPQLKNFFRPHGPPHR
ncbi:uncharacterized protein LOC144631703 isoform X2 [Oculina patagonica]